MKLEEYGTSEEKLFKLLDDLDAKSDSIYRKVSSKDNEEICKNFKMKEIKKWQHFIKQLNLSKRL